MKKLGAILIAAVLLLTVIPTAYAQTALDPAGACPRGFDLIAIGEHMEDMDHMDHHIGSHQDLNGDSYLCMRHLDAQLHLHVDNWLPLR